MFNQLQEMLLKSKFQLPIMGTRPQHAKTQGINEQSRKFSIKLCKCGRSYLGNFPDRACNRETPKFPCLNMLSAKECSWIFYLAIFLSCAYVELIVSTADSHLIYLSSLIKFFTKFIDNIKQT
jgi:hypothetical protein